MTANQLAYLNLIESQRKRAAEIAEQRRSNLAREAETLRSNLAKEAETARSNSMNESIKIGELSVKATPTWAKEFGLAGISTLAPTAKSTMIDVNRGKDQRDVGRGFLNNLLRKKDSIKMDPSDVKEILNLRKQGLSDEEIDEKLHLKERYSIGG